MMSFPNHEKTACLLLSKKLAYDYRYIYIYIYEMRRKNDVIKS